MKTFIYEELVDAGVPAADLANGGLAYTDSQTGKRYFSLNDTWIELPQPIPANTPLVVARVNLINQQAAIPETAFYTPTEDGFYQVLWYASVTQASNGTGTLGGATGFQIRSTDADSNFTFLTLPANNPTAFVQTNIGTTNGERISGVINCWAKAGVNIEYAFDYASDGLGGDELKYNLHIVILKL